MEGASAQKAGPFTPRERKGEPRPAHARFRYPIHERTNSMHSIIYIVGLVVVVVAILSFIGVA